MTDAPIDSLPKTSSITIRKLKALGINTYFDLLNYFPSRYEDYSVISKVENAQPGETVTVVGKIVDSKFQITRTGLQLQVFKLNDGTGEIEIGFFNQPYLLRVIKKDMTLSVAGVVERYGKKLSLKPLEYEIVYSETIGFEKTHRQSASSLFKTSLKHTGRIVPIYPEKKGLSSKTIREKIFIVLSSAMVRRAHHDNSVTLSLTKGKELLPDKIISFNNLMNEEAAYQQIHFPDSQEMAEKAKNRLAFDELFTIQLSSLMVRKEWEKVKVTKKFEYNDEILQSIKRLKSNLPFELTKAQDRVWLEILEDLLKKKPMNRLLQGEVGSGKTVVAALAAYLSYLNGYQTLFMAPTEILALQHYKTIVQLFKQSEITSSATSSSHHNFRNSQPKISLITGSTKIPDHNSDIIVGTHSLISKKHNYKKVGLVIVDEQHRFGVVQRAEAKLKGKNPHLLTMTATPIPRTVALTLYRELDLSAIDEMPKNRQPIKTYFVPKNKRQAAYRWIELQISKFKSQIFIVCPLIEESTSETLKTVRAATVEFENLKKIFPNFKLGLLHGRLKFVEKDMIMSDFKNKKLDILVSTPVVEVGIDIPNATVMMIEGGERFGLAQLHQLRGRVGRGEKQSYCLVFSEIENTQITQRLNFFSKTQNGNELAERDLHIRGAGNIFGLEQHGFSTLKIASLSDYELITKTKKAVEYFEKHFDFEKFIFLKERVKKYNSTKVAKN